MREPAKNATKQAVTAQFTTSAAPDPNLGIRAPPPAAATMEALRGLGYTLPTAIADLIDNSISAGAGNIWLTFHWAGRESFISILDDGCGMNGEELLVALTIGSRDPRAPRPTNDLGRFGLGLKTASFSQGRRLTVAAHRTGDAEAILRWDLDHVARVNDWEVLRGADKDSMERISVIRDIPSGTLVLLEKLDRVVTAVDPSDRRAQDEFLAQIDRVEQHLAMVFHRYLEGRPSELRIFINGREDRHRVRPWDPFFSADAATIATPVERIHSAAGLVEVQGFVLPHHDRLNESAFETAAGPEGWTAQQGFYVYRGRRLLLPGSWLGLGGARAWTKEEPYKLARLRLDLPNSADAEWKIDVRKLSAEPPDFLRPRLRDLAQYVRQQARKVFAFRGPTDHGATKVLERAWEAVEVGREGQVRYRVNRRHPAVRQLLECSGDLAKAIEAVLRVVEETVPVQRIWLDAIERGDVGEAPPQGADPAAIEPIVRLIFDQLVTGDGLTHAEAKRRILQTEPFQNFPQLVDDISKGNHLTRGADAE